MSTNRQRLVDLIERGSITPGKIDAALRVSRVTPDGRAWFNFLEKLLLWLGMPALACALIFFIAYNWEELGRFARFGLVEALIILGIVAYWKLGTDALSGKLSLLVVAMLVGALLALYGQTYQTGADPWQLFFNWALLILPWVIIGRFAALWVLWIALINLSVLLYHEVSPGFFAILSTSETGMLWLMFAFNTLAWSIWEIAARTRSWLSERWAIRLLAIASGSALTMLVLLNIFDRTADYVSPLVWVCWLISIYLAYRRRVQDLFMLAGLALSLIVVTISFLARQMIDTADGASAFLFLALVLIGMAASAAIWLRKIHAEWQT